MTNKAPAFQFYPADWERDMEEHSLEIEGAWIRLCSKLWWQPEKGKMNKNLEKISKILREKKAKTFQILKYLQEENIGNIKPELPEKYKDFDQKTIIFIESRRMVKDEKVRESNRLRKQRERGTPNDIPGMSRESHTDVAEDVTQKSQQMSQKSHIPSSSSSSTSVKELLRNSADEPADNSQNQKSKLPKNHFLDKIPKQYFEDLKKEIEIVDKLHPLNGKKFNCWQYAHKHINDGIHIQAIIDVLRSLPKHWNGIRSTVYQYTSGAIVSCSKNYNEAEYLKQAAEIKEYMHSPEVAKHLKNLIGGIGNG